MGTQFTEGAKERVTAQESVQRVQSVMDMLQPGLLGRTHGRNPDAQPWAWFLGQPLKHNPGVQLSLSQHPYKSQRRHMRDIVS
jgi:hypothetical protein